MPTTDAAGRHIPFPDPDEYARIVEANRASVKKAFRGLKLSKAEADLLRGIIHSPYPTSVELLCAIVGKVRAS